MSRSYRKTKIFGNSGNVSEKQDKRIANRCLRSRVRCGELNLTLREVSNPWDFAKDGKNYWANATEKDMRK